MKPNRDTFTVESTIEGASTAMSIDASAMQHIMAVLTDLYSDPELAVLREYSTNALDSHVEAGVTDPIEVELPNPLAPFLTIRDYGVGLSVGDIHSIYSKYGASTKRDTDAQVGMLGLGCKSGLTYAPQFTLTAVKDGVRCRVAVSRDESGVGSLTVVDTETTDDRNGVEVCIPARQGNALEEKAKRFFRYWEPDTVLVDGQEPERHESLLEVTSGIYLTRERNCASFIVMGNVAYPLDFGKASVADRRPSRVGIVAYVPIGSVHFTPSREALHYTPTTKATIKRVLDSYRANCINALQRHINAADTHTKALDVLAAWRPLIDGAANYSFTYRGDRIPDSFQLDRGENLHVAKGLQYRGGRIGGWSSMRGISAAQWPTTLWVEDFTLGTWSAEHHKKARKHCENTNVDPQQVHQIVPLVGKAPQSPFIDRKMVVSFDTLKLVKLPRTPRNPTASTRIAGSFDVYFWGGTHKLMEKRRPSITGDGRCQGVPGDCLDLSKPIFWEHSNAWHGSSTATRLEKHYPVGTLVCLPGNRIDKFCRDVTVAVKAHQAIEDAYNKWVTSLSKDERMALVVHDTDARSDLRYIDPTKVHDPALKQGAAWACIDVDGLLRKRRDFGTIGNSVKIGTYKNPLTRYPLFDSMELRAGYRSANRGEPTDPQHLYDYLNWHYANTKQEDTND